MPSAVAERVRFHLDEHVNPSVAHALRRHGADVTTTSGAGLRTRADEADHGAEVILHGAIWDEANEKAKQLVAERVVRAAPRGLVEPPARQRRQGVRGRRGRSGARS